MSGSRPPIVYWDSCVFLAHLARESVDNLSLSGMADWAERADAGRAIIVTSSISIVEVIPANISDDLRGDFQRLFDGPHYHRVACGNRVSELASRLRRHYDTNKAVNGKRLSTPDSIHIATAILYEATEFHTFDGAGDPKSFSKKASLPLIPLSGNVAGHNLTICTPRTEQLRIN